MKGGDNVSHVHNIIDTDSHFLIDPVFRTVSTKSDKLYVVQYDHESEKFTFQVPRYVEEHDMGTCTRIEIHFTNITRNKKQKSDGVYYVKTDDITTDFDTVFFKWLISREATQLVGSLKFSITFICLDDNDNITYQWSTGVYESIEVLTKLENTATVIEAYPDLFTQLKNEIIKDLPSAGVDREEVEQIIAEYLEANPPEGGAGEPGKDGEDGFSPIVNVTETEDGYEITIEDINGPKTSIIKNGKDGKDGKDGEPGVDGKDGYTPVKGVDYFTEEDIESIASEVAKQVTIDQVTPDQVVFPDGASTTYAIGNVTLVNGSGTLIEPGGTLADFFEKFVNEKNPTTVQPSVSLTFTEGKAHEVGTYITPSYSAKLNPGSYTYGPATGVEVVEWEVSDNSGNSSANPTGTFSEVQVTDELNYVITAKVSHTAGTIPVTNTGNEYPAGQILAGEKSANGSVSMTGFRRSFYGTLTIKDTLTSDIIRQLSSKTEKTMSNGANFTIDIPVGAYRVVFAYPATLRDVTSVRDVNGLNAEIASSFKMELIDVEGANNYNAISYKVYTLDFANANDAANTFTVTI